MMNSKNPRRRTSLIEVEVVKVTPYLRPEKPVLWLCEKEVDIPRLLPIAIGEFEAASIQMQLGRDEPLRPISYDLFISMLDHLDMPVRRVVIHSVHSMAFHANVVVEKAGQLREVDARASDAVALALRSKAPIFVAGELLDKAGISSLAEGGVVDQTISQFYELEPQIIEGVELATAALLAMSEEDVGKVAEAPESAGEPKAVETSPVPSIREDALTRLQGELERAVICEEYEAAAQLRDEIERVVKETQR